MLSSICLRFTLLSVSAWGGYTHFEARFRNTWLDVEVVGESVPGTLPHEHPKQKRLVSWPQGQRNSYFLLEHREECRAGCARVGGVVGGGCDRCIGGAGHQPPTPSREVGPKGGVELVELVQSINELVESIGLRRAAAERHRS